MISDSAATGQLSFICSKASEDLYFIFHKVKLHTPTDRYTKERSSLSSNECVYVCFLGQLHGLYIHEKSEEVELSFTLYPLLPLALLLNISVQRNP